MVERNDPGHLLAYRSQLVVGERLTLGDHLDLQVISLLSSSHSQLPLIASVQAEGHPHHAVETALIAVTEPHHGDLAEVVRAGERDRRRLGQADDVAFTH